MSLLDNGSAPPPAQTKPTAPKAVEKTEEITYAAGITKQAGGMYQVVRITMVNGKVKDMVKVGVPDNLPFSCAQLKKTLGDWLIPTIP